MSDTPDQSPRSRPYWRLPYWASGINAYAVVVMLGLLGRFGHMQVVPPTLERTDVLAVAGALFACEFVADKVLLLDSTWDLVHTAIRPILGGAMGVLMAHHAHGSLTQAVIAAAVGGGSALTSHTVKAGVRIGVNTSPEPVTNSVVSLLEDLGVGGMMVLVLLHPLVAAIIAFATMLLGIALIILLAARIRRYLRARKERRQRRLANQEHQPRLAPLAGYRSELAIGSEPTSAVAAQVRHAATSDQDMKTLARGLLTHGRDVAAIGKDKIDSSVRDALRARRQPRL